MRRSVIIVAVAGLVTALAAPTAGAGPGRLSNHERHVLSLGGQLVAKAGTTAKAPAGPNPYLALVPDPSVVDYAGWKSYIQRKSQERAAAIGEPAASPIVVDEDEPDGTRGSNDTPATAQPVPGFGTGAGENNAARILGTLSHETVFAEDADPNAEDDGSIPLAGDTGIDDEVDGIFTSAEIGDGPHGSAGSGTGDFDFYSLTAPAGKSIVVDTDTPTGLLDSMVLIFDDAGNEVAFNDDDGVSLDSHVSFRVPTAGDYFVAISGFFNVPADPFDSGSGNGPPPGSEGPYDVTITVAEVDLDYYAVNLRRGDVLGASLAGDGTRVVLYDPAGVEVMGSTQDATFIYSLLSPLPGGGNAVAEHLAEVNGWHYVGVEAGDGDYNITVEAYRPPLDATGPVQTLFLDLDGARVNTGIWGGPGVRQLSPLRAFLGRWGLTNADLDPLINRIVKTAKENLRRDLIESGLNPNFRLRILNSRSHEDPWGDTNVSRVIVGGTIDESGIPTIGIAQTIDPGNFGTEESALVLLDILSDPAGPFGDPSLNSYITPASNRVKFIGRAVGNIVAHEAGHFFGNWHVDQFNDQPNLQDQGGNFPVLYGVGPDGIGGTADDIDVDFGEDTFNPGEGFTGTEDTLTRVLFGVTS